MNLSRRSFLSKGFLACLFAPFVAKAAMTSTSPFVGVTSKDFNDAARVSEAVSRLGLSSQKASESLQSLGDHIEKAAKEPPRYGYVSLDYTPNGARPSEWSMKMTDGSPMPQNVQRGDDCAGWYETLTRVTDGDPQFWHLKTHHFKADFRFVCHPSCRMIPNSPTLS